MTSSQAATATTSADISDARLVDYLLRLLSAEENAALAQAIAADRALQQRLATWETVLFQLHRDTAPMTPPTHVWDNIEQRCFDNASTAATDKLPWWKRRGRILVPMLLVLSLVWVGSVTWLQRPTYTAVVATEVTAPLWKIEGHAKAITFTSVKNIAMDGMNCLAWVERDGTMPILLGVVPDTGNLLTKTIKLPTGLHLQAGDRITVGMSKIGAEHQLPSQSMMPITVVLTAI